MPKSRDKFKKATLQANKEGDKETLDSKNMFGIGDPTPKKASLTLYVYENRVHSIKS